MNNMNNLNEVLIIVKRELGISAVPVTLDGRVLIKTDIYGGINLIEKDEFLNEAMEMLRFYYNTICQ